MYVVLGAAGHIGSVVVEQLLSARQEVLAVLHREKRSGEFTQKGARTAIVDILDVAALHAVLRQGKRAFLLNPPAAPSTNTDAAELQTARAIAAALEQTGLEKVVLASTYGARQGKGIGDLSTLYAFEQGVQASGIPAAINRGAYYFTNLDMLLEPASQGVLPTVFPADLEIPMVAPADLGKAAADRLQSPVTDIGIRYVEGPQHYSFADVAAALGRKLKRPVEVATTPRESWEESFKAAGFSPEAASAYAKMTATVVDDPQMPVDAIRGAITLDHYLATIDLPADPRRNV